MASLSWFGKGSISRRLAVWFLAISALPCVILAVVTYRFSARSLEDNIHGTLLMAVESKGKEVEGYAVERIRSVTALSRTRSLVEACESLDAASKSGIDTPAYWQTDGLYRPVLASVAEAYGYPELMLAAKDGRVLFSLQQRLKSGATLNAVELRNSEIFSVFDRARTLLQPEVSDFQMYPGMSAPAAFIAGPVLRDGSLIGVAIFQLDNRDVFRLFSDYTGLGETGETVVTSRIGDDAVTINPLRHDPGAAFHRRVAIGSAADPAAQLAVQGERGYGSVTDYRGTPVRAAWLYVPSFRWGLIVKQDESEALALTHQHRLVTLYLLLLLVAPVTVVALVVARSISRPIRQAARVAQNIAAGDLKVEVHVTGNDETADLLTSIKYMASDLRGLYETMEDKIRRRTSELEDSNVQLKDAQEAADSANKAKSAFLANMSHELRTPLNAIIGYSEMLYETAGDEGQDTYLPDLNKIRTAGKHLLELINSVLDLSKIEAGKMELYLEPATVTTFVGGVTSMIRPLVEKNHNQLVLEEGGQLGDMRVDVTKLRQSLLNLLSNASKFTSAGIVKLVVARETVDGVDWLEFRVSDSGIGMTPEQMGRLFQAFSQADASTTKRFGGTGLGLAISRRFCRMMGGDIRVESEYGKGSTFTIRIPALVSEDASKTAVLDAPAPAPGAGKGLVLVIDDDPQVRDLVGRYLTKESYSVVFAASGEEGLAIAAKQRPVAITLDVLLPGLDGWGVMTALKADPALADIPVIFLTMLDERNLGYSLGAADFLVKPVDKEQLLRTISRNAGHDGNATALVVDDDAPTRTLMRRMLEDAGWTVTEAEDGMAGLAALERAVPAVVVLDLSMPVMDGFQLFEQIRSHPEWSGLRVIVCTARDLTESERKTFNGGVVQFIRKDGRELDTLGATIGRRLHGHQTGAAASSGG
jgi:signal transduction histidine kinase/DNA-binding response OmpR family regulator